MSQVKGVIGTLAQNNYYLVNIPLSTALQKHFSTSYNDDPQLKEINRFMSRLGYLCSEATLPTSSYATAEVKDNYMGVTQEFAHTRHAARSAQRRQSPLGQGSHHRLDWLRLPPLVYSIRHPPAQQTT